LSPSHIGILRSNPRSQDIEILDGALSRDAVAQTATPSISISLADYNVFLEELDN